MLTEAAREQMIRQQVRAWDVLDARVLEILGQVPREQFVPPGFRELAFADAAIPLPHGERMLTPKVAGRILQALQVEADESVLEIGTGSGFLTACLALQAGSVRSLDIHADLADAARARLAALNLGRTEVVAADVFAADALGSGSYDVIVLTGSLPLPDPRFEQRLAIGGRLFVVVGEPPVMEARLVHRLGTQEWVAESLFETILPPLHGAAHREAFRF
ncbi:MAG: protein-L-isoaspartate O-methyltransferase [Steroidobacteraceae bacterium]|nr:protein-L-isoaspartate O-methyltransferase [Nevskiaceae bacterium]MCP5338830.1 protein-L-isoaspartate O-methyltransferase [Nevskiaceae bacterium]MCP5466255.1 protein-L-isoaspartate O-methyltransferase [Nevskiaceae bacterium]